VYVEDEIGKAWAVALIGTLKTSVCWRRGFGVPTILRALGDNLKGATAELDKEGWEVWGGGGGPDDNIAASLFLLDRKKSCCRSWRNMWRAKKSWERDRALRNAITSAPSERWPGGPLSKLRCIAGIETFGSSIKNWVCRSLQDVKQRGWRMREVQVGWSQEGRLP